MFHIFISYSRKDLATARRIVDTLGERKLDTWFDWDSIPKGEDWEQEIYRGIEEADVFLFLISPDSLQSQMCNKEILHAIKNNKRILPVLLREMGDVKFRDQTAGMKINSLNWIYCREDKDDFTKAIDHIQTTIRTDYDWLRFHTMLQIKALAWERSKKDGSRLLRGKELKETEKTVARATPALEPMLTDIQQEFIRKSKQSAQSRKFLPYRMLAVLTVAIFLGGKFYYLILPISNACPEVKKVSVRFETIDQGIPSEVRTRFMDLVDQPGRETTIHSCDASKEGVVLVTVEYVAGTKPIKLIVHLPDTPAYKMDFLPEIRDLGPELVSAQEAIAIIKAASAYSVGDYRTAGETLKGYQSLSALVLTAQAELFADERANSQITYKQALQTMPQPDPIFTGKVYMGAALAWWRPESYYQLSFEGKRNDCKQAGEYYAQAQGMMQSDNFVHNIRIIYAQFCVDETDARYARFAAWKQETPQAELDLTLPDAESTNAIQQYILALDSRSSNDNATRATYKDHLIAAQELMLARAALSEFYWGEQDNCKEARTWRQAFQAGIFSDLEKTKLKRLLQNQPLFCR